MIGFKHPISIKNILRKLEIFIFITVIISSRIRISMLFKNEKVWFKLNMKQMNQIIVVLKDYFIKYFTSENIIIWSGLSIKKLA